MKLIYTDIFSFCMLIVLQFYKNPLEVNWINYYLRYKDNLKREKSSFVNESILKNIFILQIIENFVGGWMMIKYF